MLQRQLGIHIYFNIGLCSSTAMQVLGQVDRNMNAGISCRTLFPVIFQVVKR